MAQLVIPRPHARTGLTTPLELPNLAAWYSLQGAAGDATYLKDGSNRLMLVADRSGNSAVNGLVLPGATSNSASTPSAAALLLTGDMELEADLAANDWTPTGNYDVISKLVSADNSGYSLSILATTGVFRLTIGTGAALISYNSSVAPTVSDFGRLKVKVVYDADDGAGGSSATFYTAPAGGAFTQLGTVATSTNRTVATSSTALYVGRFAGGDLSLVAGIVYRAIVRNAAGTTVFDANFTAVAKLAASFTESSANAATVTINTSGDTGARICGARDRYQGTQANQAIVSSSNGFNLSTYDGSNDYDKSAPFSLSQPETVYFVGSQVSFTDGDTVFDGNALNAMRMLQKTTTPNVRLYAGGAGDTCEVTTWTTGTRAVMACVFSGASSTNRRNLGAVATGNPGTTAGGGFTVGAAGDASAFGNITFHEALVFSASHDEATQRRVVAYLLRKWGISA